MWARECQVGLWVANQEWVSLRHVYWCDKDSWCWRPISHFQITPNPCVIHHDCLCFGTHWGKCDVCGGWGTMGRGGRSRDGIWVCWHDGGWCRVFFPDHCAVDDAVQCTLATVYVPPGLACLPAGGLTGSQARWVEPEAHSGT